MIDYPKSSGQFGFNRISKQIPEVIIEEEEGVASLPAKKEGEIPLKQFRNTRLTVKEDT